MTKRSAVLLAITALALLACGRTSSTASRVSAEPNQANAQPAILSSAQLQAQTSGHPTVLLFTARGCASCIADARALEDALGDTRVLNTAAAARSQVRLVGVDIDASDTPQALQAYIQAIGLQSSGFLWTIDSDNTLVHRYAIESLSSTVLLDSSGQARFVNQGPQDAGTYAQQLSQLR